MIMILINLYNNIKKNINIIKNYSFKIEKC